MLVFWCFFISAAVLASVNANIVQTTGGQVQGETLSTGIFTNMHSFKGIPYAEPPVGNLRFRAPVPHRGWEGVRPALAHGESCMSPGALSPSGSEDCLFLNVYSPNIFDPNRPVMVWIHGGGFTAGSGDSLIYGPDYLVNDGVVVVTVNYRLGAFGFLSTEDNNAPGNYALKDLILALKWVGSNIENFGGNANDITIFGQSAGSVLVHYLVLSPAASGLFSKAIAQSGSALNPWSYHPFPSQTAFLVGQNLGIQTLDSANLIAQMRTRSAADIVRASPLAITEEIPRGLYPTPFVPSLDPPNVAENERFLPLPPIEMIRQNRFNSVPFISGYTDAECVIMLRQLTIDPRFFTRINENPSVLIPFTWNIPAGSAVALQITDAIYRFYFNGQQLSNSLRNEWSMFWTDQMFAHGIDTHVRLHSERQAHPVYYYLFSFEGDFSVLKSLALLGEFPGAVHSDDLFYQWKITSIPPPVLPSNAAQAARRQLVRLWTNFAKTGNPTSTLDLVIQTRWPSVMGTQEFLDFNNTLIPGRFPLRERMNFWNDLKAQFAPNV